MKSFVTLMFTVLVLAGCGGAPMITSPADGTTYDIETFPGLQVTLADMDTNTQIQFRGAEALAGEITCQGYGYSGMCTRTGQFGMGSNCMQQTPCAITIVAQRNGLTSVSTVYFRRGAAQAK